MSLSVLASLALMLLLFSSIIHVIVLFLPAWVQLGVYVPFSVTEIGGAEGGGEGGEEGGIGGGEGLEMFSNGTTAAVDVHADSEEDPFIDVHGPRVFVNIRLGLWEWCQQFQEVTPDCQEPGYVGGVRAMGVVVLFTLPLSFLLLSYAACLQPAQCQKTRRLTLLAFLCCLFNGLLLLVAVATYGVLTRREIRAMLLQIGDGGQEGEGEGEDGRSFLGWAFGAEGVTCALVSLAALCLGLHLRHGPKGAASSTTTTEFQLVV
ncbi:uncharacterized protein LOC143291563 [Babylonia areolata]|uniref:uncharacterized protein LOC143291563 n=1 Tax=Babylonia areolata TaxID=304850 RepID=UPI003FD0C9E0